MRYKTRTRLLTLLQPHTTTHPPTHPPLCCKTRSPTKMKNRTTTLPTHIIFGAQTINRDQTCNNHKRLPMLTGNPPIFLFRTATDNHKRLSMSPVKPSTSPPHLLIGAQTTNPYPKQCPILLPSCLSKPPIKLSLKMGLAINRTRPTTKTPFRVHWNSPPIHLIPPPCWPFDNQIMSIINNSNLFGSKTPIK